MNATDIIKDTQAYASEWLEMSDNPDAIVSGILANKIVSLLSYIEYLEKRIKHGSTTASR
jgi:hypothetical protein